MPQASHRTPRVRTRGPSGSAFDQYLLDIRRLPLITDPREERKLAYKARKPHLLPRTEISVLAGPPVDLSAYVGKPVTAQLLREATTTIMRSVAALLEQLREEHAPEDFYDAEAAMTKTATVQQEGA